METADFVCKMEPEETELDQEDPEDQGMDNYSPPEVEDPSSPGRDEGPPPKKKKGVRKGISKELSTFIKWGKESVIGRQVEEHDGKKYVTKIWCKLCARYRDQIVNLPACKGASAVSVKAFAEGTEHVTKHQVDRHLTSEAHKKAVMLDEKLPEEDRVTAPKRPLQPYACQTHSDSAKESFIKLMEFAYDMAVNPSTPESGVKLFEDCIKKLQDLQGQAIECPLCQKPTLIPSSGIDGLEKNLDVVGIRVKEVELAKCQLCIHKVYPPKPVTLFCNDCEIYSCGACSDAEHLKPENAMHSIILATAKLNYEANGNTSHNQSFDMSRRRQSFGTNSEMSFGEKPSSRLSSRPSSSLLLDTQIIPECPIHGEKMRIYCRTCRCLICSYCEAIGDHRGHDSFQVHEAEEKERLFLQKLQQKVDSHSERFIKARGDVQRMIEDVKKNSIGVKDVVRRYFRELRATIDSTEKTLVEKLSSRSEVNLKALREQLSKMINISSMAKTASRNCDNALSYDYYEMLLRRRPVEEEIEAVLQMMVETEPVAKANVHCQFPKHESLLNSIKTCCFIVEAPPPPSNFTCSATKNGSVVLEWNDGENMQYIYQSLFYNVQASIGEDNKFVDVEKLKERTLTINPGSPAYLPGSFIQFRVSAENIVGKGNYCNPFGIKIPMRFVADK